MNLTLPSLTVNQFSLVYNMLSFAIATMLAAFIFFILSRETVDKKYRVALTMSTLVVAIAGYHYFRISESLVAAFTLVDGMYVATSNPFNDAYRYVDWLLTVPLLVAELIAVLTLPREKSLPLTAKLAFAAFLMIALGYPGEIAETITARAFWGFMSTIPFIYILYVLWTELGRAIEHKGKEVKILVRNTRLLLLATWGFYPIVYLLPMLGVAGATAFVAIQVGYSIADVLAKAGYGVMIYAIARAETREDVQETAVAAGAVGTPAVGD